VHGLVTLNKTLHRYYSRATYWSIVMATLATSRKAATLECLDGINDIDPSGTNRKLMETFFAGMSDAQFHAYVQAIKEKRDYIPIVMENLNGIRITMRNVFNAVKVSRAPFNVTSADSKSREQILHSRRQ
jgi:hypothetical protein